MQGLFLDNCSAPMELTIYQFTWILCAFPLWMTFSIAAGIRMSHFSYIRSPWFPSLPYAWRTESVVTETIFLQRSALLTTERCSSSFFYAGNLFTISPLLLCRPFCLVLFTFSPTVSLKTLMDENKKDWFWQFNTRWHFQSSIILLYFGLIADCISVQQAFKRNFWNRRRSGRLTDLKHGAIDPYGNTLIHKFLKLSFPTNLISFYPAYYVSGLKLFR